MPDKRPSRLTRALLETAHDTRRSRALDPESHGKITLRHRRQDLDRPVAALTGDDIRRLREQSRLSQAVFARTLKLTVGYVSQLERGVKQPSGPALVLLDIIRRKGLEAIL